MHKISACISLALETREVFFVLHIAFTLGRVLIVWTILKSILAFNSSLEMTYPDILNSSGLLTFGLGEAWWPSGRASDSGGFDPHSGRRVLSLSKIHLPPQQYW